MARRSTNVFSLSFLDAMTCGFGAVVLFFMVINASSGLRADRVNADLSGEVDRLEREVLDGYKEQVDVRNSLRAANDDTAEARGLATRLVERIAEIRVELARYDAKSLAKEEHLLKLQADLKSLEEQARRLAATSAPEEPTGDRGRSFVGDGDRQYLTGLKVGGRRILILVDASASMLDETIVNIVRRSLLSDELRVQAEKWQRVVSTVDWLTTQLPADAQFQLYTFDTATRPVVPGSDGRWLDAGDREVLDDAVARLRKTAPAGGTSLYHGFQAIRRLDPAPDNVLLLADGLPTQGKTPPKRRTVSGKRRARLFEEAVATLRPGIPINTILFPMEGDPLAAAYYWKLALHTRGSMMSPSADWP